MRIFGLLLALAMVAKGTSFIFSKMLLESMGTFNVLAIRFLAAFALLVLVFFQQLKRAPKRTWIAGVIVGSLAFVVMALELTALTMADTGAVALVEHTAIVMVPFAAAALGRYTPAKMSVMSALIAVLGVGLLAGPNGGFTIGYAVALMAAVAYTAVIVLTDRYAKEPDEGLCIGIIQLGVLGACAAVASFIFEEPHMPGSGAEWAMMVMLVLVCSCFGFVGQAVAQSRVSAESTGLLAALNPSVAAVLGAVVMNERFGVLGVIGLVLVLVAIVLPYLKPHQQVE